tara:strand:+ start:519 stop:1112 length:594 start_codon:yes stop_codon:yes gene_type:complete
MNKKNLIQLMLVISLIVIVYIFYINFFVSKPTPKEEVKIENQDIETNDQTNVIENLKYISEDLFGNRYIIEAKSAEIIKTEEKIQEKIIKLITVNAVIESDKQDTIYISSDFADYNRENNNTIFKENVKIKYANHFITSDIINLNFEKNMVEILGNVHYTNLDTKIYADKVEIDLISKNLKISMNDKIEEVLIEGKY